MSNNKGFSPFFIAIAAVLAISAGICVYAASCSACKINFSSAYYFVYYSECDNSISASSISGAVSDFGGAGYILEYNGKFYVTVACYYTENDAAAVCAGLKNQALNCKILNIETDDYRLSTVDRNNATLYTGNLNTLNSLSSLAYECANGLDTGKYSQSDAKKIISDIKKGFDGLMNANTANGFTAELRRLWEVCDGLDGYVYSKNLRKLQIAIANTVINIKF